VAFFIKWVIASQYGLFIKKPHFICHEVDYLGIIAHPLWNRKPMVRKPKEVGVCPWCGTETVFYRYGKQRCPECLRPIVVSPDDPSTEVEICHSSTQRPATNDERLKRALLSQISFWEGIVWEFLRMSGDIELRGLGVEKETERIRSRIEQLRRFANITERRRSWRIPVNIKVKYGFDEPNQEGCAYNLSEDGMSISDATILGTGSTIKLDFYLNGKVCKTEGVVVWAIATESDIIRPSMGIMLLSVSEEIKGFYHNSLSLLS